VLVVGSCGGDKPSDTQSMRDEFDEDLAAWHLPLDTFRPDMFAEAGRWNYAENLLIADCLEDEGLPGFPPDIAMTTEGLTNDGRQLFNIEIAREHGYAHPGSLEDDWTLSEEQIAARENFDAVLESTPDGQARLDACRDQAREDRPADIMNQLNLVNGLRDAAWETARSDDDVEASIDRWRECMEPLGVADLPELPDEMPSDAVRQRLGIPIPQADVLPDPGSPRTPTVEEIEFAVHDAECRESSGYAETCYEAEVEAQFDQIEGHEDELDRALAVYDETVDWAEAVLAEHA
jgi:hypothetical protein